jgi:hypothetical protein
MLNWAKLNRFSTQTRKKEKNPAGRNKYFFAGVGLTDHTHRYYALWIILKQLTFILNQFETLPIFHDDCLSITVL